MRGNNYARFIYESKFDRQIREDAILQEGDALRAAIAGRRILSDLSQPEMSMPGVNVLSDGRLVSS